MLNNMCWPSWKYPLFLGNLIGNIVGWDYPNISSDSENSLSITFDGICIERSMGFSFVMGAKRVKGLQSLRTEF